MVCKFCLNKAVNSDFLKNTVVGKHRGYKYEYKPRTMLGGRLTQNQRDMVYQTRKTGMHCA